MGQMKNSPLIEAIFELRWGETAPGQFSISMEEQEFLPGRFQQQIKQSGYSYFERPVDPTLPAGLKLPHKVNHRFRRAKDTWPCFQIGLGIFTANQLGNLALKEEGIDRDDYDWDTFLPVILSGIASLDQSLSGGVSGLGNAVVMLNYQDGFVLGDGESYLQFLQDKLRTSFRLPDQFMSSSNLTPDSTGFNINLTNQTLSPDGELLISISSGMVKDKRAVLMNTICTSRLQIGADTITMIRDWADKAHTIQRHTFDTLITPAAYGI